jgi:hypothetical protein
MRIARATAVAGKMFERRQNALLAMFLDHDRGLLRHDGWVG